MRIISEGRAIESLHEYFDLACPVAFDDVKKQYRQKARLLHPDAGGSEEAFKALSGAFDELKQLYQIGSWLFDAEPLPETDENGEHRPPPMPRETVDGIPLSELGLGLGPTTNGRDCSECDHRGYNIYREHGRAPCKTCGGSGRKPREYFCRSCGGSGRFRQRRSGRVVDCYTCQGSGRFKHPHQKDLCDQCFGSGQAESDVVAKIYATVCTPCKGKGEQEIWNPVLPKGRLAFSTSK